MKMMIKVIFAVICLFSFQVQAVLIEYDNESDFLTAITGLNTNVVDFESQSAGDVILTGSSVSGVTFDYFIDGFDLFVDDSFDTTSPVNYLGVDVDDGAFIGGDSFTMSFASEQSAFGLFIHSADLIFDGDITLETDSGLIIDLIANVDELLADGEAYFIGFSTDDVLEQFNSVTLSSFQEDFAFNVDDITTASTVIPEPNTWSLILLVITALTFKKYSLTKRVNITK
ncbi:hypothetical protein [Vibrio sp. HN007]|uniref:hypothetical protein n=1 Tax=Vibrio iocasae TaxID=3098914 RepID=UPI0035D42E51